MFHKPTYSADQIIFFISRNREPELGVQRDTYYNFLRNYHADEAPTNEGVKPINRVVQRDLEEPAEVEQWNGKRWVSLEDLDEDDNHDDALCGYWEYDMERNDQDSTPHAPSYEKVVKEYLEGFTDEEKDEQLARLVATSALEKIARQEFGFPHYVVFDNWSNEVGQQVYSVQAYESLKGQGLIVETIARFDSAQQAEEALQVVANDI